MTTTQPTQDELHSFVSKHVLYNQTMLVEELLKDEFFQSDDIENMYQCACTNCGSTDLRLVTDEEAEEKEISPDCYVCNECLFTYSEEAHDELSEPAEVFEWWLVDTWFADKLKNENQPVLDNSHGTWWGRMCTGQAIYMDSVIETIYKSL